MSPSGGAAVNPEKRTSWPKVPGGALCSLRLESRLINPEFRYRPAEFTFAVA